MQMMFGLLLAVLLIAPGEAANRASVSLSEEQSDVAAAGSDRSGQTSGPDEQLRFMEGRLSYRRKTDSGTERGREHWSLTRNRDGSRTMRVVAMTDDSKFVRDIVYTLDATGRPLLVLIQLQVGSELVGSGYFRVSGDRMTVITDGIDTGHTVQVVNVPERFHVLTHAVMLDGWPAWALDFDQGGSQTIDVYTTSPLWNGTSGPLGRMTQQRFTLVGTEEITVPAGTFQARRLRFGDDTDPERASHVWITGEDNILLKYDWPAYGMEYLLESLTIEAPVD